MTTLRILVHLMYQGTTATAFGIGSRILGWQEAQPQADGQPAGDAKAVSSPLVRTPELIARARELHARGYGKRRIAATLGVSPTTAMRMISPEYFAREKAWGARIQRQGTCVDCGKQISSNRSAPAKRCRRCHLARVRARAGGEET
jgi:hypothetical protein